MMTPWGQLTDDFRKWLTSSGITAEEFNDLTAVERSQVRANFDIVSRSQQQSVGK